MTLEVGQEMQIFNICDNFTKYLVFDIIPNILISLIFSTEIWGFKSWIIRKFVMNNKMKIMLNVVYQLLLLMNKILLHCEMEELLFGEIHLIV